MVLTKESDFVEIDYVGRIKDSNKIFDLTSEALAKKEGIKSIGHHHYGSKVICLGMNNILSAIDKFLINKETGKTYTLELSPEQAFGKKDPKLMKIFPVDALKKQNINPVPGLQINATGLLGTIVNVAGGRVTIDFNHPLASKHLLYEITINKIVSDDKQKISSLVQSLIGLHDHDFAVDIESNKAVINSGTKLPKDIKDVFTKKVKAIIPSIDVSFSE
ncbi:MAG: peptidylprolyl isomerase [Nanoarchaeota archaeon]